MFQSQEQKREQRLTKNDGTEHGNKNTFWKILPNEKMINNWERKRVCACLTTRTRT